MRRPQAIFSAIAVCILVAAGAWATLSRELWVVFVLSSSAGTLLLWRLRESIGALGVGPIIVLAVLVRLAVIGLPPTLSDDAYRFVWDGRVQALDVNVYDVRPNDVVVDAIDYDGLRSELNSATYYSVYPPASQVVFRAASALSGTGWPEALYSVKGLFVLAEIIGLWILSRLASTKNLALYALNPLVVVEVAGQAHTEALLIPFMLGAILLSRTNRGVADRFLSASRNAGAGVALGVATLVKLYPVLWLPSLVRRAGVASLVGFGLAAAALSAPYYSPTALSHVRESLDLYIRSFEFNAGPYYFFKEVLRISSGTDFSKQIGPLLQRSFLFSVAVFLLAEWLGRGVVRRVLDGVRLERVFFWVVAGFLVTATTVHPWYFVPLLALWAVDGRQSPAWLWLAAGSTATYLFYSNDFYWPSVCFGWLGWAILMAAPSLSRLPSAFMRWRSGRKARLILPFIPHTSEAVVLDLGCGEGYVAEAVHDVARARMRLMDVVDYHRFEAPFTLYDGTNIPLPDRSVDATMLYFVLHHTSDPRAVVREALRVTNGNIVIVESTFRTERERRLLTWLDRLANRIRSGGAMVDQELAFRTKSSWRRLLEEEGAVLKGVRDFGVSPHRQVLFVCGRG